MDDVRFRALLLTGSRQLMRRTPKMLPVKIEISGFVPLGQIAPQLCASSIPSAASHGSQVSSRFEGISQMEEAEFGISLATT
jgi:hypothetical protein